MSHTICVPVDVANPGQFFACCGLLELAGRLWPGAWARFVDGTCFEISEVSPGSAAPMLMQQLRGVGLTGALTRELAEQRSALEVEYKEAQKAGKALPKDREARRKYLGGLLRAGTITVGEPFCLLLDWWQGDSDKVPKTWAGSMQVRRVAMAALSECGAAFASSAPFEYSCVLRPCDEIDDGESGDDEEGKAEPFYFDSTRGANASPIDQGFSANKLSVWRDGSPGKSGKVKRKRVKMESAAFPAVELLALIGLQRFRPMPTGLPRVFEYRAWQEPLPSSMAAAAACGLLPSVGGDLYRFENAFRTDQRKHKGFLPAIRVSQGDAP